jgi:hypothetical protein
MDKTDKITCCQVCGDGVPLCGAPAGATWVVCRDCSADGYTDAPGQDVLRAVSAPPARRLVVSGRIDREQIKLVVDALWEHCDEVAAWQAEVVSCR